MSSHLWCCAAVMAAWAALLAPAPASAQTATDPGDSVTTAAGPIVPGTEYDGALDSVTDADWYQVNVEGAATAITVTIARTSDTCEVWAHLVSLDGAVLGQVVVSDATPQRISAVTPAGGAYFVVLDNGPAPTCSGATYSVSVALADAVPSLRALVGPRTQNRPKRPNVYLCSLYTSEVDAELIVLRRTLKAHHHAHGSRRLRLRRKLVHLRSEYSANRKHVTYWCGPA